MNFKDYYEELGIPHYANEQLIKQAYRSLAREYHPDVNNGDKQSEERFKSIIEAYQVLSNKEQRQRYDVLHRRYRRWLEYGNPEELDWSKWQTTSQMPNFDFFFNVLDSIIGGEEEPQHDWREPRPGDDLEIIVELSLEEALHGVSRLVRVNQRQVKVSIAPGVQHGAEIRMPGYGTPGLLGLSSGDLYIIVQVLPHDQFERFGDDLHTHVSVDIYTALLGGVVTVTTLDGDMPLAIPPRTQSGTVFCLNGRGMPRFRNDGERGDMYAHVNLVFPETLSDTEVDILCKLGEARRSRYR